MVKSNNDKFIRVKGLTITFERGGIIIGFAGTNENKQTSFSISGTTYVVPVGECVITRFTAGQVYTSNYIYDNGLVVYTYY